LQTARQSGTQVAANREIFGATRIMLLKNM
jgi:hypothetical protein